VMRFFMLKGGPEIYSKVYSTFVKIVLLA